MHIFSEYIINTKSYRLWEDGFKQRYYSNKFGVDSTDRDFVSRVVSILYIYIPLCMLQLLYFYY